MEQAQISDCSDISEQSEIGDDEENLQIETRNDDLGTSIRDSPDLSVTESGNESNKNDANNRESMSWYDSDNDWTMVDPVELAKRLFNFGVPKSSFIPPHQRFPDGYLTQKRKRVDDENVKMKSKKERRIELRKKYDPETVDWSDTFAANVWMEYMSADIYRGLVFFENSWVYRKWLWNVRRSWNMGIMHKEKSGITQGWTTLSRIFLLESLIKAKMYLSNFSTSYYVNNELTQTLSKVGLIHTFRKICDYDALDLLLGMRIIARSWTSETVWKNGISETVNNIELLLHDLNLRGLDFVIHYEDAEEKEDEKKQVKKRKEKVPVIRRNFIFEIAHMTGFYHYMITFWKDRVVPHLMNEEELCDYRERSIPSRFVRGLDEDEKWNMYQQSYENIRKFMYTEFLSVAKMGIITRSAYGALRYLLLPYDIFVRYNNANNRDTSDGVLASEAVLSQTEINYLDFEMGANKDETLLNAVTIDSERKWIFEAVCMTKLCDDLMCQYNLEYRWMENTVVYDRDLWRVSPEEIFGSRLPVILFFGCSTIFIFRRRAMILRDSSEAFMLWIFAVFEELGSKVPVGESIIFDLNKEIRKMIDICFEGIRHVDRLEFGDEEMVDLHDTDSERQSETEYDCENSTEDDNSETVEIEVPDDESLDGNLQIESDPEGEE